MKTHALAGAWASTPESCSSAFGRRVGHCQITYLTLQCGGWMPLSALPAGLLAWAHSRSGIPRVLPVLEKPKVSMQPI
ncbi:hypothetical protein LX36DRAFT_657636 [Colletotrichum falcatum]|nr:hypothetical protein LX36DRAFT_657636 [Colletotrichum falcatum]